MIEGMTGTTDEMIVEIMTGIYHNIYGYLYTLMAAVPHIFILENVGFVWFASC